MSIKKNHDLLLAMALSITAGFWLSGCTGQDVPSDTDKDGEEPSATIEKMTWDELDFSASPRKFRDTHKNAILKYGDYLYVGTENGLWFRKDGEKAFALVDEGYLNYPTTIIVGGEGFVAAKIVGNAVAVIKDGKFIYDVFVTGQNGFSKKKKKVVDLIIKRGANDKAALIVSTDDADASVFIKDISSAEAAAQDWGGNFTDKDGNSKFGGKDPFLIEHLFARGDTLMFYSGSFVLEFKKDQIKASGQSKDTFVNFWDGIDGFHEKIRLPGSPIVQTKWDDTRFNDPNFFMLFAPTEVNPNETGGVVVVNSVTKKVIGPKHALAARHLAPDGKRSLISTDLGFYLANGGDVGELFDIDYSKKHRFASKEGGTKSEQKSGFANTMTRQNFRAGALHGNVIYLISHTDAKKIYTVTTEEVKVKVSK